jgi:F-type H+-transporting ATPase subunit delta
MNDSKISVRYSHALFQSAIEKKMIDRVYRDMAYISEMCRIPEIRDLLNSPIILPAKKREIMHNLLGEELEKLTLSFIDMVIKNTRESYIPAIARVFVSDTLKHKGITETILTTAVGTNEKVKKEISYLVSSTFNTKVELKEIIDKDIIGGFILKIDDKLIDASIRNKLRKIEKELKSKTFTA